MSDTADTLETNEATGFRRILVYAPIEDEACPALEQAARVAASSGAGLTLIRVLDESAWWAKTRDRGDELRALLASAQQSALLARAAPLRARGLEVDVEVRWGTPWLELIRLVLRDGYDLVVKTAEGVAMGRRLFFGSTALHLIRKCPCPVWIVKSPVEAGRQKVLAAVDPELDPTRLGLAQRILGLAAGLLESGAEVHVAAAWTAAGENLLQGRMPAEEIVDYVKSAEEEARENLEAILARASAGIARVPVHLLKGEARDVLPMLVEREAYDLLVIGSLGRVGIAGLLIGDTAESLIRSVKTSVVALKPPGFVCPVRREDA